MNWTPFLIIAAIVVIVIFLKNAGRISATDAQARLDEGAIVIDVRSPGEFRSGHLDRALNIPLDEIESALPKQVTDKQQVILLHCQSGMRSGVAAKKLRAMGYEKVYNLGSLSRARSLVGDGR